MFMYRQLDAGIGILASRILVRYQTKKNAGQSGISIYMYIDIDMDKQHGHECFLLVSSLSPASAFQHDGQSGTISHGLVR
jgi:hypothetical protein